MPRRSDARASRFGKTGLARRPRLARPHFVGRQGDANGRSTEPMPRAGKSSDPDRIDISRAENRFRRLASMDRPMGGDIWLRPRLKRPRERNLIVWVRSAFTSRRGAPGLADRRQAARNASWPLMSPRVRARISPRPQAARVASPKVATGRNSRSPTKGERHPTRCKPD